MSRPSILWVACWALAWQVVAAQVPAPGSADVPLIREPAYPAAVDDFGTDVQGGVTQNAYDLVPLAEHDAARTQSMIDGIAGRDTTRPPGAVADATERSRRLGIAALWLPGLMVIVLMVIRRRGRSSG